MTTESQQVAEQLQKWAKRMGFVPNGGADYPSVETFQKICKGKTIPMWQSVVKQIKPKDEALHVQKVLLLQRLKSGKSLESDPTPDHLTTQIILSRKLAAKQKEKQELLESIAKREASIKSKIKTLSKSGHKIHEQEAQIDEFKKKQLLFKVKSNDCRSKLEYFKDMAKYANGLIPPLPRAKPNTSDASAHPEAVIHKCIEDIRDFHSYLKRIELNEMDGDITGSSESDLNTSHLKNLWSQIISNVKGWGAQELWETLESKHFEELLSKIKSLCQDSTGTMKPAENHASMMRNSLAILTAKQTESSLECILLQTKIKIKRKELQMMKEELIQTLKASSKDSLQFPQNENGNLQEVMKHWIDTQCDKAELLGKIEGIKHELVKHKDARSNRSVASSSLKLVQEELSKLDVQVDQDKRHLEGILAQLKVVPLRLKAAHAKALTQKSNFNSSVPIFLEMSKSRHNDEDVDSFPPVQPTRLQSTMIDETISNVSFNTTLASIPGQAGQNGLTEVMAQLKESVSKEAKLFIKLHLGTVPFVIMNGKRASVYNLMVQAPSVTLRSSNVPYRNFLKIVQGPPFLSTPRIILDQLNALIYVKALHLYQLLHELPAPSALQAPYQVRALKECTAKQAIILSEKLEVVNASQDKVDQSIFKVRDNLKLWIERPIQRAVPRDLVVNDLTFNEWCKLYDGNLSRRKL